MERLELVEELLGQAIEAARSLTFEPSSPVLFDWDGAHKAGIRASTWNCSELTAREREVLRLVTKGHTNKDVAARLGVSVKTVSTHRQHIMDKLNIHNAVGLVKYAIRHGLTSLDSGTPASNDLGATR